MDTKPNVTYAGAGVNIDAGNALVERIKPLAKATARAGLMGTIGGFGALFDMKATGYKDPILVSTTDGVGTKIKVAIELGSHDTIGIDLVAMCVNDLIVQGAEPLLFLDYFATSKLDVAVGESIIKGIVAGCKLAGCALVGGETAEMPGMYKEGDYDLAGFAIGAVERDRVLPRKDVKAGDIVLGLASSGLHSNGFSLVRHILEKTKYGYHSETPFEKGKTFGEILIEPTKIYVKSCLKALRTYPEDIRALVHITGGGLIENIPRVIPRNETVLDGTGVRWKRPPIFKWLQENGPISKDEMFRTFNCGIGMIMVVSKSSADVIKKLLEGEGETVYLMGTIAKRVLQGAVILR